MEKEQIMPKKKSSANINDWAKALREKYPQLAETLDEDKGEGIRGIEELNLPRYKKITTTLEDFEGHTDEYLGEIGSQRFYISLTPREKGLERFGKANLDKQGVLDYISENISPDSKGKYNIVLQQYFDNIYGGNIVIGEEKNQFIAEMKEGMMSGIASGYKTPEITITRDSDGVFRYGDIEDETVRKMIYKTFLSIPYQDSGNYKKFTPGYYELAIVKDDEGIVRPIFTDYRKNPAYQVNWEKLGPKSR